MPGLLLQLAQPGVGDGEVGQGSGAGQQAGQGLVTTIYSKPESLTQWVGAFWSAGGCSSGRLPAAWCPAGRTPPHTTPLQAWRGCQQAAHCMCCCLLAGRHSAGWAMYIVLHVSRTGGRHPGEGCCAARQSVCLRPVPSQQLHNTWAQPCELSAGWVASVHGTAVPAADSVRSRKLFTAWCVSAVVLCVSSCSCGGSRCFPAWWNGATDNNTNILPAQHALPL